MSTFQAILQALEPEPEPEPDEEQRVSNFRSLKAEFGLYQSNEVGAAAKRMQPSGGQQHLVAGLIRPRTVNILVGDSGIGKSPLTYQMALAIAGGIPFLGIRTRQANVLLIDYENSLSDAN